MLSASLAGLAETIDSESIDTGVRVLNLSAVIEQSSIRSVRRLTDSLNNASERAVVVAIAITLPYSQVRTEGRTNRLKLVKRSMCSRDMFDPLRPRINYVSAA